MGKVIKRKLVSLPKLLAKAQRTFNKWVRIRDEGRECISCGSPNTAHASHFYAAGSYTGLRFNEMNVHASCVSCNTYKHGNIHDYRKRLVQRIGKENLEKLDAASSLNRFRKYNRFELEAIILMYETK